MCGLLKDDNHSLTKNKQTNIAPKCLTMMVMAGWLLNESLSGFSHVWMPSGWQLLTRLPKGWNRIKNEGDDGSYQPLQAFQSWPSDRQLLSGAPRSRRLCWRKVNELQEPTTEVWTCRIGVVLQVRPCEEERKRGRVGRTGLTVLSYLHRIIYSSTVDWCCNNIPFINIVDYGYKVPYA